jgi:hypothetical protein
MGKNPLKTLDRAVGTAEAARLLGIGERGVAQAIQRGNLKATELRPDGGAGRIKYRIEPEDLRAYDARRRLPINEKAVRNV